MSDRSAAAAPSVARPARRPLDIPQFRDAASSHPLPIRLLNRVGRLLPSLRRPLSSDEIWDDARKGSVADCEPTPEARAALEVLLDSLAANVPMALVGRFSAKDDTTRLARTHLRIHQRLAAQPSIRETPLPPAVFIVGWPRTGSTFLHQLMACDPRSRAIPYWESFDPVPPDAGRPDRRIEKLDRTLALLARIEPRYDAIHPMTAISVEECVALFMNEFRTLQLDLQYHIPEYVRWLRAQDAGVAYDLYRDQLRLIQHHRPAGERLLLKDPTHLVHLETLIERFPEARFVFTHRDPAVVFSSICSLVCYTRALFTDDVDPHAVGREVTSGYWVEAMHRARELRPKLAAGRTVDVRHPDLRADPIGSVERIYAALGLELDDVARDAMRRFLERRAREGAGRHEHALEGFGSSRDGLRAEFAGYCADFDL